MVMKMISILRENLILDALIRVEKQVMKNDLHILFHQLAKEHS